MYWNMRLYTSPWADGLIGELLDGLPGEVRVVAAKVAIGSGLLHDRASQVEVTDDAAGAEVEVALDNLADLVVRLTRALHASAIGVDEDRQGVVHTDRIGQLHKHSVAEAGGDHRLSSPAGGIGGRAIHLGGVLAREGTTSVSAPATIGVDNDLAASEAGVTVRSANNETARGVKVVDGLVVQVLGGHNRSDDVFHELGADIVVGDVLAVLGGNNHGVHALGNRATVHHLVLAGDLGLSVGAHPRAGAVLADLGQLGAERGGQLVGEGHESLCFVGGISEHDSLITSTNVLELHVVDRLSDIGGLLLDGDDNVAGSVIHTLGNIIVSNITESLADNLLVVHGGRGGDLTEDHNHTGLGAGLTSHTRGRVITDAGVKDGIRDLITDLIRVSLIDRFRRKKEVLRHC
mmetsp:Transcript_105698/g.227848  ORF Transcript_105698/g.227848 Transcript_105698/m.227848 type:complete len:405 (-) Transcript_105698:20-1234(-)